MTARFFFVFFQFPWDRVEISGEEGPRTGRAGVVLDFVELGDERVVFVFMRCFSPYEGFGCLKHI